MHLGVLGINYKSSDLNLREVVAKACQRCFGGQHLRYENKEAETFCFVLLSTCNRTEIYFSGKDLPTIHSELLSVLRQLVDDPFEHKVYSYFGADCFTHLALVTAGLDSVIIAETEIQRQVKTAYENASLYGTLSSEMHYLFQKCLKIGKEIRSSFPIPHGSPTLERMIFELSCHFFASIAGMKIFFIGNSEINRKILSYFLQKGAQAITLCTRALHSAEELLDAKVDVVDWSKLATWKDYDLIISGTNQHDYLIGPKQIQFLHSQHEALKTKLIFDLSVPRTVDPVLKWHPYLNLLNIEELGKLIDKRQKGLLKEIENSKEKIRLRVEHQIKLFNQKQKRAPLVCV